MLSLLVYPQPQSQPVLHSQPLPHNLTSSNETMLPIRPYIEQKHFSDIKKVQLDLEGEAIEMIIYCRLEFYVFSFQLA